jgi:hypothetical protein
MATPATSRYNIYRFWDDEFKTLDYVQEPFNDSDSVARWLSQGYQAKITGDLCDMRHQLPSWNQQFIDFYQQRGWQDIGVAYYCMHTGTVMPEHRDLYKRYIEVFDLYGKEQSVRRAIVFLEDWKSGHYLELDGEPVVNWQAGDVVEWHYDTPHMAANIGLESRYTLQVTGHL